MDHTASSAGADISGQLNVYREVPLDLNSSSIRLLSFCRDHSGVLHGRLGVFELATCPPFMALSYAWGTPQTAPENYILIQNKHFALRQNLYAALHAIIDHDESTKTAFDKATPARTAAIRDFDTLSIAYTPFDTRFADQYGTEFGYIWIDSICIDQSNIAERNDQVSLMKEIYQKASLVIAWVGPSNASTKRAIRRLRKEGEVMALWRLEGTLPDRKPLHNLKPNVVRSIFSATHQFFDLEYFHRMWVVQEILFARRLVILCGEDAIDGTAVNNYVHSSGTDKLARTAGASIFRTKYSDLPRSLHRLIPISYRRKCMDPRDRVFALLGIAVGAKPIADYAMSPLELYLRLLVLGIDERRMYKEIDGGSVRQALEIPDDLYLHFDEHQPASEGSRPLRNASSMSLRLNRRSSTGRLSISKSSFRSLNGGFTSKLFLRVVKRYDWTSMQAWSENYKRLQEYSKSLSKSSLLLAKHLDALDFEDVQRWAENTLAEDGNDDSRDSHMEQL